MFPMKHEIEITSKWQILIQRNAGSEWRCECEENNEAEAEKLAQYLRDTTKNHAIKVVEVWV